MSALTAKADICSANTNVRMGQERTSRHLFDDLVRSTDERIGEVKAELLGCPEIDD